MVSHLRQSPQGKHVLDPMFGHEVGHTRRAHSCAQLSEPRSNRLPAQDLDE